MKFFGKTVAEKSFYFGAMRCVFDLWSDVIQNLNDAGGMAGRDAPPYLKNLKGLIGYGD